MDTLRNVKLFVTGLFALVTARLGALGGLGLWDRMEQRSGLSAPGSFRLLL